MPHSYVIRPRILQNIYCLHKMFSSRVHAYKSSVGFEAFEVKNESNDDYQMSLSG